MKIPLNAFEQLIDEKILERGLSYFQKGRVSDFTEISTGTYEATVTGTESYTVQLELNKQTIVDHHCDCPYDMGAVCKHVVAVIFHLQQDELELGRPTRKSAKKKKTKTVSQQIKELLKEVSHDDLINFMLEATKKDQKLRNYFISTFGHLTEDLSKEFYQKQIHAVLKTAKGRDGWIGWSDMKYVASAIQPFVINMEKYFDKGDFENTLYLSTALLEETATALNYADDSNGDMGYFVSASISTLSKLSEEQLPEKLRSEIFDYCLNVFNQELLEGWDWHLDMMGIATHLVKDDKEAAVVMKCLDKVGDWYGQEQAQLLKLRLLRKFGTEKEAKDYVNKHIANPYIRRNEMETAFREGDYKRVIALAQDGIETDVAEKPGLVRDWYIWLLQVAEAEEDKPTIIKYARHLLIKDFHGQRDYYEILQKAVEPEKWHSFLEELIEEVKPKGHWSYTGLLHKIYVREQRWDRLFQMLKENASLENIERNEEYLKQDYANELVTLYKERLLNYMERSMGRSHYRTVCKYMRRMKKLGGVEEVSWLVSHFKETYPKRKALMDELRKL